MITYIEKGLVGSGPMYRSLSTKRLGLNTTGTSAQAPIHKTLPHPPNPGPCSGELGLWREGGRTYRHWVRLLREVHEMGYRAVDPCYPVQTRKHGHVYCLPSSSLARTSQCNDTLLLGNWCYLHPHLSAQPPAQKRLACYMAAWLRCRCCMRYWFLLGALGHPGPGCGVMQ